MVIPTHLSERHATVKLHLTPLPWLQLCRSRETNWTTFQATLVRQMTFFDAWVDLHHGKDPSCDRRTDVLPEHFWMGAFLFPKVCMYVSIDMVLISFVLAWFLSSVAVIYVASL